MKASCSIEKLKKAVNTVERITGKNLTLPVLSTILLIAKDKNITLRSTNLNLGIQIDVPAKIEEEGVVCIMGSVTNGILNSILGDEMVTLSTRGETLNISTKQNKVNLKLYPHEDFPTLPVVEGVSLNIPSGKLIEGIKSVYYSATTSDVKPEIASVYIYPLEDNIVFVATDSFRLAEKKIKLKNMPEFPPILIPYKNIIEIIRVYDDVSEDIEIILSKNQCSFVSKDTYLTSRLIDGVFPDYKQIIPKSFKTEVIVLKNDLLNTIKLSTIISDKFNQITLSVNVAEKKMRNLF